MASSVSSKAQAQLCLYDYLLSADVHGDLTRTLAAAKGAANAQESRKIVAEFLSRRGYETSPEDLRDAFKEHAQNPIKLSPQAVRFAVEFAASPTLRLDWLEALKQTTAAALRPKAPAAVRSGAAAPPRSAPSDVSLAPFEQALKRNGYANITPFEANLALKQLLSNGIANWLGDYRHTSIADQSGASENGPALLIDGSGVKLDDQFIFGYTFDADTNTLTWTAAGTGNFTNKTAATLRFSADSGTKAFAGSLALPPSPKYTLSGNLYYQGSLPADSGGGGGDGGGGGGNDERDWAAFSLSIIDSIISVISLAGSLLAIYFAYKKYRLDVSQARQAAERLRSANDQLDSGSSDSSDDESDEPLDRRIGRPLSGSDWRRASDSGVVDEDLAEAIELQEAALSVPSSAEREQIERQISEKTAEMSEDYDADVEEETDNVSDDLETAVAS